MSFANTLVVMTSNVGSAIIAKGAGVLGVQLAAADKADNGRYSRTLVLVLEELKARGIYSAMLLSTERASCWMLSFLLRLRHTEPCCVRGTQHLEPHAT